MLVWQFSQFSEFFFSSFFCCCVLLLVTHFFLFRSTQYTGLNRATSPQRDRTTQLNKYPKKKHYFVTFIESRCAHSSICVSTAVSVDTLEMTGTAHKIVCCARKRDNHIWTICYVLLLLSLSLAISLTMYEMPFLKQTHLTGK